MEAAQSLRSDSGGVPADISSLFWQNPDGSYVDMELGVECIVDREIEDDFGRVENAQSTFLRYEITLRCIAPTDALYRSPFGPVELIRESLEYIAKGDVTRHLPWTQRRKGFRGSVLVNNRTVKHFISTEVEDGQPVISVRQAVAAEVDQTNRRPNVHLVCFGTGN